MSIHNDEIWSIDLMEMSDYNVSDNKEFRYVFLMIDIFSKYAWCFPSKDE